MTVKRIDPSGWYEVETTILCGKCVKDELDKTAAGQRLRDESTTLDMVSELSLDDGAYQCDNCLEQSENYDDEIADA